MSTLALVHRVQHDKLAITLAYSQGRLSPKTRWLAHLPADVIDYAVVDKDLTFDEHQILRNTIEDWLRKAKHEL